MHSIRLGAILCASVFAPALYASAGEKTMYGQSHRDVLRMGLVGWERIYEKKGQGMEEYFEASSFYLTATHDLNLQVLAKRSKREREQWLKLGSGLHKLGADMYGAVQIAIEGGSAFGWGISSNRTHIAIEELIYKLVTSKEYHENPIRYSAPNRTYQDWVKKVEAGTSDKSELRIVLVKAENNLNWVNVLASKIGPKQKSEVESLVSNIAGYWISKL